MATAPTYGATSAKADAPEPSESSVCTSADEAVCASISDEAVARSRDNSRFSSSPLGGVALGLR